MKKKILAVLLATGVAATTLLGGSILVSAADEVVPLGLHRMHPVQHHGFSAGSTYHQPGVLGTQFLLLDFQIDEGFQLVLRGDTAIPGEHGHHLDAPAVGYLDALCFHGVRVCCNILSGLQAASSILFGLVRKGWQSCRTFLWGEADSLA